MEDLKTLDLEESVSETIVIEITYLDERFENDSI